MAQVIEAKKDAAARQPPPLRFSRAFPILPLSPLPRLFINRGCFQRRVGAVRCFRQSSIIPAGRIWSLDEEADVAELFRQRFRREARRGTYVLHFAGSGGEALELLADEIEPTLLAVPSDINMPGMDGLELLGEITQFRISHLSKPGARRKIRAAAAERPT